ncbi:succinyl-diaminopimelate desuccinylase [Inquilinus sp. CAU 1745]|uniref:succinyl-diaminopimelate desuccinylase n=1 Tax=Inquilinus sp. CAU 1745 TaxID=3140369 RepID=UPI00325A9B3F
MSGIDPVALARALIRCPSVTPADEGALDTVQGALEGLGFVCHRLVFSEEGQPDIDNLYARLGTGGRNFCFAGHTDVVPVGDSGAWTHDPFGGVIADGLLYGRGAADMKGAVAAFAGGVSRFLDGAGPEFGGSVSLLITGDEEGDAVNGTRKVLGWLKERGERIDACIVGEPTNPDRLGQMIKIGRRGSMTGRLTVHGIQGHTAYPAQADNPLPRLVRMLEAVTAEPLDRGSDHFDPSNLEITTIDVGNPVNNVIPAQGRATINIRFNDLHDSAALEGWLRECFDRIGGRYELSVRVTGESFLTPPGPLSELVAGAVERVTGLRPELSTTGGTSDARFIKDRCPVVEFGLVNRTIHQVDEHVETADIDRLADIYAATLAAYFGKP